LPWEASLQSVLESITGPVARIIAVMVIILTDPATYVASKRESFVFDT